MFSAIFTGRFGSVVAASLNMKNASIILFSAVFVLAQVCVLNAQEKKSRVSPHETVKADIDGNEISIVYGRPYTKDPHTGEKRKIWGGLLPFNKVWRLGADEATLLTTQKPLEIGGKSLPAGTYSLFLMPRSDKTASLIINKQTGQWGTKYDEKQDLVRVDMKGEPDTSSPDQLSISIDKNSVGGGTIKVAWENTQYSVDFRNAK
jgi:DUF2911 family protein